MLQYTEMASGLHEKPLVFVMGSAQKEEVPEAQLQGKQNTKKKGKKNLTINSSHEHCDVNYLYKILASQILTLKH